MAYTYSILGAGRQGVALAYDLAANGNSARITLADAHPGAAARGVDRVRNLLPHATCEWIAVDCDLSDASSAGKVIAGSTVVISALPYRFNLAMTDVAVAAGASFCDLGGNTAVVREQLSRHVAARQRGVSIVPDCGLAPGLGNTLAAYAIECLDRADEVRIRCGGLPESPVGPLGYKLVFNFDGLINEYSGFGEFIRAGRRANVPTLTEIEEIDFPPPVGRCEAAVTSGGSSTAAETFLNRVQSFDYKTVRYPGHWATIRALFELGCFEPQVKLSDGSVATPRATMRALFEEKLSYPDVRDLVVLRVTARGERGGKPATVEFELIDRHDECTGFTAMERATAFPAALVAYMQARGLVAPGAVPLERAIPNAQYVAELPAHDIRIATRWTEP